MTDYSSKSSKKTTKSGEKSHQRDDKEDRSLSYRLWRRECGTKKNGRKRATPYTSDIDQVEYVFKNNEIIPVALLEITRYDFNEYDLPSHSWAKYRSSLLNRYFLRDAQGKFIKTMGEKLGCKSWIVLFRHDLKSFWLFDVMHRDAIWVHYDDDQYKEWLETLRNTHEDT